MTMFKKITAVLISSAIILCLLLTAGCATVSYNGEGGIVGEGKIITKNFTVGDFTKVTINMHTKINLVPVKSVDSQIGASGEVKIKLYENFLEYLEVNVEDKNLTISSKKNFRKGSGGKGLPTVYIPSETLESLSVSGVVEFMEAETIVADSFKLSVSGVIDECEIDFTVKELSVNVSGVGDIELNGTADRMFLQSSGVGDVKAFGLVTKEADVHVSGVGSVEVYCNGSLDANLSGVGDINYKGKAEVNKDKNGLGVIRKAD